MTLRRIVVLASLLLNSIACAAQRPSASATPGSGVGQAGADTHARAQAEDGPGVEVTDTCSARYADLGSVGGGRLPFADIRKTLRTAQPSFDTCLNRANARGAQLHGTLAFAFVVGRDGKVVSAWADETVSTITDPGFTCCVVRAVERVVFPLPTGGSVLGRYSLNLVNDNVASRSVTRSGS